MGSHVQPTRGRRRSALRDLDGRATLPPDDVSRHPAREGTMAWPRRTAALMSLLGLALVVAACGGSTPTVSPTVAPTTGSPPPATPPASTSAPASGPTGTSGDV